jgi:hypothetical protein
MGKQKGLTVGRLSFVADSLDKASDKFLKKSLSYKDGDKRADKASDMAAELYNNAQEYRSQVNKAKKKYYENKVMAMKPSIKTDATYVVRNSIPLSETQFNK